MAKKKRNKCKGTAGGIKSTMIIHQGSLSWEEYLLLSAFADAATKKGETIELGGGAIYSKRGKTNPCSLKEQ